MSYLLGGAAAIIILHIYYRIGQVHLRNEKLIEQLDALDEAVAKRIAKAAIQTEVDTRARQDKMLADNLRWINSKRGTSNDNGGDA